MDNVALRAYMSADAAVITLADLVAAEPAFATASAPGRRVDQPTLGFIAAKTHAIRKFEYEYLTQLMQQSCGNISAAARLSGTERRQLGKLLQKHGIGPRQFRPR